VSAPFAIDKYKLFERIGYKPHPKQQLYHNSTARFKVPVCGRRFGKSTMAARDVEAELFQPGRMYWIVGPTYDLGEKEFRVIWDDLIVGLQLGQDKRIKKAYNKKQGNMFIEFPWRTRIEVRSAEHPENLVGEGLHGVIMSEAAKHRSDTWERYVRAALADYRGWASFPTTPEGQNWLYKLWQFGRNPELADYVSWRFPSWDNPTLYPGGRDDPEIKLIEQTTAVEWFLQEIAADFTAFVGKIYGEFVEETHVTKVEFNPAWPSYVFFDWGFVNPLCALFVQVDPRDNVYIWKEHYKGYQILSQHVAELRDMKWPEGFHLDMGFGDAADPEAVEEISQTYVQCVGDPEAKVNWREGVQLVKTFLKPYEVGQDEYGGPLYKPKLFVDHSCINTIREFNNYKAKQGVPSGRNPSNAREMAQTIDDHAMDALRYGLMHIFKLGATHSLAETMHRGPAHDQQDVGYTTLDEGVLTTLAEF
jgi:hypothetical protein